MLTDAQNSARIEGLLLADIGKLSSSDHLNGQTAFCNKARLESNSGNRLRRP
jgi:hypothetical protein